MITGRYEYRDTDGKLLYWKERIEPGRNGTRKEFRFWHGERQPGRGGEPSLYLLPDVIKAKAVIITEGEKQADLLKTWGLCATSLDSGAGSRLTEAIAYHLMGKRIAILRDNDKPGAMYALKLASALQGKFESLRIVLLPRLPDKGDICDWDGDKRELLEIIRGSPEWIPPPAEPKKERRKSERTTSGELTEEMIEAARQYPIEKLIEFQNGKALCFNHEEKTPSMTIYRNKCRCHGACGQSFSTIDVLMIRDQMTFKDAVNQLQG